MGYSGKSLIYMEKVMSFFLLVAVGIILFLLFKIESQKNRIIKLTENMERFILYPLETERYNLEEGYLANLCNQVAELEKQFTKIYENSEKREYEIIGFVENMAHQIKNVITALQIQLDILHASGTKEQLKNLEKCQDCVDRLGFEVERILKSSQIAAHKIQMIDEKMNLRRVVEESIKHLYSIADERNVKIHINSADEVDYRGDSFWISQAIENIIKNAIEHTESSGTVKIEICDENRVIRIRVDDEGSGIPEDEIKFLFHRFHRGKHAKAGYGIGLAMAKDIIEAHHGDIHVGNNELGGAFFQIELLSLDGPDTYR